MIPAIVEDLTEVRDGWVWPKADAVAFDHIKMYIPLLRTVARYPNQRKVCVQAGGNAGMHPAILAEYYDKVITFEPDDLNFFCLQENCKDKPNVVAHNKVLGAAKGKVGLEYIPGVKDGRACVNSGSITVKGSGDIEQVTIDSLGLNALDFLQLDVEGYELDVLKGGIKTIDKYSPVIMLECFEQGADPRPLIEELGYRRIIKGVYDQVYVRQSDGA